MSDFGIFENQPAHLLTEVLERVSYNDLNSLALSSKFWHSIIKEHVESPRFKKDILQTRNTFDIGKLIGTIISGKSMEKQKDYDALGDAIRGFCTNSEGDIRENVKKLFIFTWNLVEHLDALVKKVDEEFDVDVDDELEERIAGRRRMELRRQLHSLFWKDADSEYKGFIFIQLINKNGHLVGATLGKIYNFLQIVLNPTGINDSEEYVRIDFLHENEVTFSLDMELLKPFAGAFKACQSVCSTTKDNKVLAAFFHSILTSFFFTNQIIALFALEPSLLMWYLHDFSYVARDPYFVAYILLEMTMKMRNENYGSLEDLKSAFIDLKNHVYNRFNGHGHLAELHNSIESAKRRYCTREKGIHQGVLNNDYTRCLDILSYVKTKNLIYYFSKIIFRGWV